MDVLKFITIMLLLTMTLLPIEKLLHPSYSLKEVVYQLKKDIKSVFKAFLITEPVRHTFDIILRDELCNIIEPYKHKAFEIELDCNIYQNVPVICTRFVPKKELTTEELLELTKLMSLKFRRYLIINGLNFKHFADYRLTNNYIYICIYYAETPEDDKNIILLYNRTIRQKSDIDYGVLRDEDLSKELNNVD